MSTGKVLQVFVKGRTSKSFKIISMRNWSGIVYTGGRAEVKALEKEANGCKPAVYFLFGEPGSESGGLQEVYIGESDNVSKRLGQQLINKQWWQSFVVFTSNDEYLTKAHVRHLEKRFSELARNSVGSLRLKDGPSSPGANLAESDISVLAEFENECIFILEALGICTLTKGQAVSIGSVSLPAEDEIALRYVCLLPRSTNEGEETLQASLEAKGNTFTLLKGSKIRKTPVDSFPSQNYFANWNSVVNSRKVRDYNPVAYETVEDIEFASLSAAASVVLGRTANGPKEWKNEKKYSTK